MKKEYKFIAVKALNNFGGIGIVNIVYGLNDTIVSGFDFGDGIKNVARSRIRYNCNDESYFVRYGVKYFLSDFIRI